jgi:hypothetical protein
MLKSIINYPYTTIKGDVSGLTEKKSKCYKDMVYIFNNGELLTTVGLATISKDNYRVSLALEYDEYPTKLELDMLSDEPV